MNDEADNSAPSVSAEAAKRSSAKVNHWISGALDVPSQQDDEAVEVIQADRDAAEKLRVEACPSGSSARMFEEIAAEHFARHRVAFNAPPDGEREFSGAGFVYWNPDAGEEYASNHPIESGECIEAERVRRSTPQEDTLRAAYQEQWQKAEALSLSPHQGDREAIAREVEPEAWKRRDRYAEILRGEGRLPDDSNALAMMQRGAANQIDTVVASSLATADRILSLLQAPPPTDEGATPQIGPSE